MSYSRPQNWRGPGCYRIPDPYIEVLVGGMLFGADHAYDPFKIGYHLNGWKGWQEGPEPKTSVDEWENADGGQMDEVLYSSRELEFSGFMRGRDEHHLHLMMEELGGVLTRPREGDLVVREQMLKLERQIRVKRGGRPVMKQQNDTIATWSAQFSAASWKRLGVTEQRKVIPAGGVDLLNLGNVDADVLLLMEDQLVAPGIKWRGGSWTYGSNIGKGLQVSADMTERKVFNPQTTLGLRRFAQGDWLSLPPGTTRVSRTGSGTGTVTAIWRHSWS